LETVAGELGRDMVVSADFAAAEGGGYLSLGRFTLEGFEIEQKVFARPSMKLYLIAAALCIDSFIPPPMRRSQNCRLLRRGR
jgi:hypothetical protein